MGEKVDAGQEHGQERGGNRRFVSEGVIAVLFALNELEGVYDFPQAGDDSLLIFCKPFPHISSYFGPFLEYYSYYESKSLDKFQRFSGKWSCILCRFCIYLCKQC